MVHDSPDDARVLEVELQSSGYDPVIERVATASEMRTALARAEWDLILSDYLLPRFKALEALAVLKESGLDLPFIIVADAVHKNVAVECIKEGAHDVLSRNDLTRLAVAVEREAREASIRREHKQATRALAESEERFRWLFANMVEGVAYCRMLFENNEPKDFLYLEVNNAFENLTGLKNVVGRKVSEVIPGIRESDPELFAIYGRVALTGKPERFETHVAALGIWFSISVYSPRKEHFVAVFDVITARKKAEEQMEKLFTAVEHAPDTVVITDLNGIIEYVNPAFEKLTGYNKAEAVGQTPALLKSGKHPAEFYQEMWKSIASGQEFRAEFINKKKNGEIYHHEATIAPVMDTKGKITHFVATGRDITRRKEIEERLLRFTAIIEATSDFVAMADPHGRILYINSGGRRMLGLRQDDDLSTVSIAATHAKWAANLVFNEAIPTAIRDGSWLGETAFLSRDGREIPTSQLILSHKDAQGHLAFLSTVARDISEFKRMSEGLRASELQYRSLFETASDMIGSMSPDGIFTAINPAFEAILGWAANDWIGKSFELLIHPNDLEATRTLVRHVVEDGVPAKALTRVVSRSGALVTLESTVTPQFLDRSVTGLLIIARDVTERIRQEEKAQLADEALRESEERYRIVTETVSDAILALDPQSYILFTNPAVKNVFGYEPAEIIGRQVTDLMPERMRPQHSGGMKQYLLTNKKRIPWEVVELTGLHKNGREVPIEVSFAESVGKSGRLFIGIVRDISERRKAEETLKHSEEKFRTLFEESRDTIFISSPDGTILDLNPAGVEMFGYSDKQEILSLDIAQSLFVNPEDRKLYRQTLESNGFVKNYELLMKRKDGRKIWVLETSSAVRDKDGRIVTYRGTNRDVTHLKLLQEQLLHSQKMETIGRLAGGVAHDFNNILMAVSGYCELLLMKMPQTEPLRSDVQEILKAQRQGASLTRQLLAFSRKQILEPKVFDLNVTVSNLENMLQRLIGEDIELTIVTSRNAAMVEADPGQIEQVIMNLAVNSRDAMPRGGRLTIEVSDAELDEEYVREHMDAKPGPHVTLSVTDTGHGMDHETLSHVFEPFFTTKEKEKGTGLGLATVYGIVTQSHGSITAYSEPGQGTMFRIYLPRVRVAGKGAAAEQPAGALAGGSEIILLVDDNEIIRSALGELLKMQGYSILLAGDGKEALEVARKHAGHIDLLVTDVVMPGMSGRELAEQLATERAGIKVLYMSGYTDDAVLRHGILDSGSAFLQKPAPMNTLLRKIRELLD
jgi:PAS domain S-box-containing protein